MRSATRCEARLHPGGVHGVQDGPRRLGDIAVPAVLGHLPPADLQHAGLCPVRGRNRLDQDEPDGGPRCRPPATSASVAQLNEAEALDGMVHQAHKAPQAPACRRLVGGGGRRDEADQIRVGVQTAHELEVTGRKGTQPQPLSS